MRNSTIYCISSNYCSVCTKLTEKIDKYLITCYPICSYDDYAIASRQSDAVGLNAEGINNIDNTLWSSSGLNPPNFVGADNLHNIFLRILDYLMNWT